MVECFVLTWCLQAAIRETTFLIYFNLQGGAMQAGQVVYFKARYDVRLRKGEIVEREGENKIIRGCRTAGKLTIMKGDYRA
jgi:hypothetical protein